MFQLVFSDVLILWKYRFHLLKLLIKRKRKLLNKDDDILFSSSYEFTKDINTHLELKLLLDINSSQYVTQYFKKPVINIKELTSKEISYVKISPAIQSTTTSNIERSGQIYGYFFNK